MGSPVVLAHAYGIPEAITVVVPMIVLVVIMVAGKRRRDAEADDDADGSIEAPNGDDEGQQERDLST